DDDIAAGRLVKGEDGVWRVDPSRPGKVRELVERGVLGIDQSSPLYPALLAKIDEVVDDMGAVFRATGQREGRAGARGMAALNHAAYFPRALTPAGEQSLRQRRSRGALSRDEARSGLGATEAFEKPVTTRRHR